MNQRDRLDGGDDAIWKALADPTRRALLDELRQGPQTTGALCSLFEMSRYGVMKHLRVLEEAGLILVEARGRERWNHLNAVPIRAIYRRWIRPFEEDDADSLLKLKRHVEGAKPRSPKASRSRKGDD